MADYTSNYTGKEVDDAVAFYKSLVGKNLTADKCAKLLALLENVNALPNGPVYYNKSEGKFKAITNGVLYSEDGVTHNGVLPIAYGGSGYGVMHKYLDISSAFNRNPVFYKNNSNTIKYSIATGFKVSVVVWGNVAQIYVKFKIPSGVKTISGNINNRYILLTKKNSDGTLVSSTRNLLANNGMSTHVVSLADVCPLNSLGFGPVVHGYFNNTGILITSTAGELKPGQEISLGGTYIT